MRPHLTWHGDPNRLNRYVNRPDAEALGGTIPYFSDRDLFQRFRTCIEDDPRPEPIMHMTLSLPKGIRAIRKIWLKIIKAAMTIIGLDPEATLWFSKRHRDTDCDHVHTAVVLRDFAGRPLHVSGSDAKAEEVHRHLCEMLGLPQPQYFNESGSPRLDPITPKRRLVGAKTMLLHAELQKVFRNQQPETLADLNHALSKQPGGFEVEIAENQHGIPAFKFTNSAGAVFGGALGKAWQPRHLQNLLHFTRKLRRLRDRLELDHLVQIFKNPNLENIVDQILARPNPARTAIPPADHPEPAENDGPARPRPARPVGSSGSAGRPAGVAQRNAGEPFERPLGPTGAISGRADKIDGTNDVDGEPDQRHGREIRREPAAAEQETRPDSFNLERTHRPTIGSLLAKVCALAAKRLPGWRLRVLPKSQQVGIAFADRSAAVVDQHLATVVKDGEEARAFQADYSAIVQPPEQEPDIEAGPDF